MLEHFLKKKVVQQNTNYINKFYVDLMNWLNSDNKNKQWQIGLEELLLNKNQALQSRIFV